MRPLHEVIADRRDDILRCFCRRLEQDTGGSTPASVLLDSLPELLAWMVAALAALRAGLPIEAETAQLGEVGGKHGLQRLGLGFDVHEVVREYGVLRECLYDVIEEEEGGLVSAAEVRVLAWCIDRSLTEAVRRYARQRDDELRRHTNQHFAFVAHELRNPLMSARIALDLARKRGLLLEGKPSEVLERNLARLQELVDESLNDTRRNAGVDLERSLVSVAELLAGVAAEAAAEVDAKGLRFTLHAPEDLRIDADARLLRSAASNLVRNAVKFSREGGDVAVRAKHDGEAVSLEVEDSCGGLPPGAVERAFGPYVQVGADRSGFGIGLAITKQVAEAHGGSVRVRNIPGKGCAFVLELPAAKPR